MSDAKFIDGEVFAIINYRLNELERQERKIMHMVLDLQEYRRDIQRLAKDHDALEFLAQECARRFKKEQQQREYARRNNVQR